jgi:hypothetical protein
VSNNFLEANEIVFRSLRVPSQFSAAFIELIGWPEIFSLWDLTVFPAMRVPLRNPEQRRNAENRGHGERAEISKLIESS